MKKMVLATLLAVVMTATSIPAFAAEAPVEEITVEAEEAVEEVEAVACEESEEAEKATAEAESAEAEVDIDESEDEMVVAGTNKTISEMTYDELSDLGLIDAAGYVKLEPQKLDTSDVDFSGLFDSETDDVLVEGEGEEGTAGKTVAKPKAPGKVSGFKCTGATYYSSNGLISLGFKWNDKKDALGYIFGIYNDRRAADNTAVARGYATSPLTLGSSTLSSLTPHTVPYSFRVNAYNANGEGKSVSTSNYYLPAANDVIIDDMSIQGYVNYWTGKYKYYIEISVANNSDKVVSISGKSKGMKVYDNSTGNLALVKSLKTKKSYKIKPGYAKKVKYWSSSSKTKFSFPSNNIVYTYFPYRGKRYTQISTWNIRY